MKQRTFLNALGRPGGHPGIAVLASAAVVLAACGGDDDTAAPDSVAEPTTTEITEMTETTAAEPTAEPTSSTVDLLASQSCLESAGMAVAVGDEASTGLTADMMDNLGIVEILTFDKGAGWGGTIEAYATSAQADVAAAGYGDSPFGYEVGRFDDVVFKTTGPAEDLDDIAVCLGDPGADLSEMTAPTTAAAMTTVPATTAAPSTTTPATTTPATTEPDTTESTDASELDADRQAIFDVLTSPDLEAQDVIFDRPCLTDWALQIPDADAALLVANGFDSSDPALSPAALTQVDVLFACLDLDAFVPIMADVYDADPACVEAALYALDLEAASIEAERDIDNMFRILSDAAFDCA